MGIRIAVLASGRGSNLVAIMQAIAEKKIDGEIAVVLSDKAEAKALEHAKNAGIPAYHVNPKAYEQKADYEAELLRYIEQADMQLICLAGYMLDSQSLFCKSGYLSDYEYFTRLCCLLFLACMDSVRHWKYGCKNSRLYCSFCG